MNELSNRNHEEETMQTMTDFEMQLRASAPEPRAGFEEELSQHLQREFIQRRQSRRMLPALSLRQSGRLSLRTAVLVAVLTIGVGVVIAMNIIFQQFIQHDAGLQSIYAQELGHEIGISQTIDGFTVTLEWAYADGNRLTLAYVIQGQSGVQYTNLASDLYALRLRSTGEEIPLIQGMHALIDNHGEMVGGAALTTADRGIGVYTYDLSNVLDDGQTRLDLQIDLAPYGITLLQRTLMPIEQFDDMKEGPETIFTFDFSVALVNEMRTMNNPQTVTDQNIELTLRQVMVSPSQIRVVICFAPPDPARQWTAIPQFTTTEGDVPGSGGVRPFMDREESFQDYTYFADMFEYAGEWRLEIIELVGFGSSGNDQQRITGSWVFEFVVP